MGNSQDHENAPGDIDHVYRTARGGKGCVTVEDEDGGSHQFNFDKRNVVLLGVPLKNVYGLDISSLLEAGQRVFVDVSNDDLQTVRIGTQRAPTLSTMKQLYSYCNSSNRPETTDSSVIDELVRRAQKYCDENYETENEESEDESDEDESDESLETDLDSTVSHLETNRGEVNCDGRIIPFTINAVFLFGIPIQDVNLKTILDVGQAVKIDIDSNEECVNLFIGGQRRTYSKNVLNNVKQYCAARETPQRFIDRIIQSIGISNDELQHPKLQSSLPVKPAAGTPQGAKPKQNKKGGSKAIAESQNIVPMVGASTEVCAVIVFVEKYFGKVKITDGPKSCLLPFKKSAVLLRGLPVPRNIALSTFLHAKQIVNVMVENNKITKLWIGSQSSMQSKNQPAECCQKNKKPTKFTKKLQDTSVDALPGPIQASVCTSLDAQLYHRPVGGYVRTSLEALPHRGPVGEFVRVDNLVDLSEPLVDTSGATGMSSYQIPQELIDLNFECDAPSSQPLEIDLENLEPIYEDREVVTLGETSSASVSDSDDDDEVFDFADPTDKSTVREDSVPTSQFLLQLEKDLASFLARNNLENNGSLATTFMEEYKKEYYQQHSSNLKESHLIPHDVVTPFQYDKENSTS